MNESETRSEYIDPKLKASGILETTQKEIGEMLKVKRLIILRNGMKMPMFMSLP